MHKQNVSFFCESPIVLGGFMQNPTSDAHSNTYSIDANFEGISYPLNTGKLMRKFPTICASLTHYISIATRTSCHFLLWRDASDPGKKYRVSHRISSNATVCTSALRFAAEHSAKWRRRVCSSSCYARQNTCGHQAGSGIDW